MADLFSVIELAEVLEIPKATLDCYINMWGDEFPDSTLYDQGARCRRARFYDVKALAKVAKFVAMYACKPSIQMPADITPATGMRLITSTGVQRIMGISNHTIKRWYKKGLLPNPVFVHERNGRVYWNRDILLKAVNDIINQRVPTPTHPEGSPYVPHSGRAGARKERKGHLRVAK